MSGDLSHSWGRTIRRLYKPMMKLWWLSFAGDDGWLGACIVEAPNAKAAVAEAWRLNINPGGEILIVDIEKGAESQEHIDIGRANMNRLFTSKPEVEKIFGALATIKGSDDDEQNQG